MFFSGSMAFLPSEFMFPTNKDDTSPSTSLNILPSYPPQDFHGVRSMMLKRSMSFSEANRQSTEELAAHGDDDLSDDGSVQIGGEKKKRLNLEQVKTLEKSFELANKLEPERKMQLARALGLQPRQVAIWFQNRRARWKTKQLEKDYDLLKKQFQAIRADNDALHAQNKKLRAELMGLKGAEVATENEGMNVKRDAPDHGSWSNGSENSTPDVNLDISRTAAVSSSVSSQLFPQSMLRPTGLTQFIQGSSRSDQQSPKIDQIIEDESFCNMLCNVDEQPGFWAWPDHHQFQ